jgi:hypothetical protein
MLSTSHHLTGFAFAILGLAYPSAVYFGLKGGYEGYFQDCINDDLGDIPSHYRLKELDNSGTLQVTGPSAFWVAELETSPGRYEIVGYLALGMFGLQLVQTSPNPFVL